MSQFIILQNKWAAVFEAASRAEAAGTAVRRNQAFGIATRNVRICDVITIGTALLEHNPLKANAIAEQKIATKEPVGCNLLAIKWQGLEGWTHP